MKKVQLTARKIRFYFLIVNQVEKYFWQAKAYLKQREVAKKNSS